MRYVGKSVTHHVWAELQSCTGGVWAREFIGDACSAEQARDMVATAVERYGARYAWAMPLSGGKAVELRSPRC